MNDSLPQNSDQNTMNDFEMKIVSWVRYTKYSMIPLLVSIVGYSVSPRNPSSSHFNEMLLQRGLFLAIIAVMMAPLTYFLFQVYSGITRKTMCLGKVTNPIILYIGILVFLTLSAMCLIVMYGCMTFVV